jgi:hypothetical protein
MTVRNQGSRWTKRKILSAAFVAMSGIGVAFAFVIPASADFFIIRTGITPEAAKDAAAAGCVANGLAAGAITEQTTLPDGTWQVTMTCVERTNPIPSGVIGEGRGPTQEEARANANKVCVDLGLVVGNQIGMEDLGGEWKATVECLAA